MAWRGVGPVAACELWRGRFWVKIESIPLLSNALAGAPRGVITWFKQISVRKITKQLILDRLP